MEGLKTETETNFLTNLKISVDNAGKNEYRVFSVDQQNVSQVSSFEIQPPATANIKEIQCLLELKCLMNDQADTRDPGIELDDEVLLAFVRGKRCNGQKAFKTLLHYIHVRKVAYHNFFLCMDPRNFQHVLGSDRFFGILKHTDRDGCAVGVYISSLWNSRVQKGDDIVQAMTFLGLELLRTDNAPRNGLVLVIDAAGFGFKHAREFSLSRINMFFQLFHSSYPVKYRGVHILNNSIIFDTTLAIIKKIVPKKIQERIHLHGSSCESLKNFVPIQILPERYGGLLKDTEAFWTVGVNSQQ